MKEKLLKLLAALQAHAKRASTVGAKVPAPEQLTDLPQQVLNALSEVNDAPGHYSELAAQLQELADNCEAEMQAFAAKHAETLVTEKKHVLAEDHETLMKAARDEGKEEAKVAYEQESAALATAQQRREALAKEIESCEIAAAVESKALASGDWDATLKPRFLKRMEEMKEVGLDPKAHQNAMISLAGVGLGEDKDEFFASRLATYKETLGGKARMTAGAGAPPLQGSGNNEEEAGLKVLAI